MKLYRETAFSLVEIDLTKKYFTFVVTTCLANLDQAGLKTRKFERLQQCNQAIFRMVPPLPLNAGLLPPCLKEMFSDK